MSTPLTHAFSMHPETASRAVKSGMRPRQTGALDRLLWPATLLLVIAWDVRIQRRQPQLGRTFATVSGGSPGEVYVALTRQAGENHKLQAALSKALGQASLAAERVSFAEVPCIEHARGPDFERLQDFMSNAAAGRTQKDEDRSGSSFPLRIASVGRGTTAAIQSAGLDVEFEPSTANAESLALELPASLANRVLCAPSSVHRCLRRLKTVSFYARAEDEAQADSRGDGSSEEPLVQLKRRAASVPPRPSPAELCEAQENEVEDGRYVQYLQQKLKLGRAGPEPVCPAQEQEVEDGQYAQSLHTKWEPICVYNEVELESNASTEEPMIGHVPSEDIPSEGGESPMQDKPKCNPGSAGHPELCRRPCIYFALGQCTNEADCNFCHLSHNNRSATLDKSQRQVIKQMSQHAFLSMLLQSLQSKAAEGCFELDAEDVLQLFREQIGRLRAIPSKVPKTKIMNLEKALMRMTFFSVASLTSRGSFDTGFIELCKEKVTFLRQKVA
eukprot:s6142_g4.t4